VYGGELMEWSESVSGITRNDGNGGWKYWNNYVCIFGGTIVLNNEHMPKGVLMIYLSFEP